MKQKNKEVDAPGTIPPRNLLLLFFQNSKSNKGTKRNL